MSQTPRTVYCCSGCLLVDKVDNALGEGAFPSPRAHLTTRVATRIVNGRSSWQARRDAHVIGFSIKKSYNLSFFDRLTFISDQYNILIHFTGQIVFQLDDFFQTFRWHVCHCIFFFHYHHSFPLLVSTGFLCNIRFPWKKFIPYLTSADYCDSIFIYYCSSLRLFFPYMVWTITFSQWKNSFEFI